jgi:hypothetical protein
MTTTTDTATHRPELVEAWQDNAHDAQRYALLRESQGKRVYRFRVADEVAAKTLIVKTWSLDRGSPLRRLKRSVIGERGGCENEFGMARHLRRTAPSLNAPDALARFHSLEVMGKPCDVLLMEDLGVCTTASEFIKRCAANSQLEELDRLNHFVADSVAELLFRADVIDNDHSVINIVLSPLTGQFHRIDFEVGQFRKHCRMPERAIGGMLGRLLATYTFASQPHIQHVPRFVDVLCRRLASLPPSVWQRALLVARAAVERQRVKRGVDSRPDFGAVISAATPRP